MTESIVRMDGTFYKPQGGNTKFIKTQQTLVRLSKSKLKRSFSSCNYNLIAPGKAIKYHKARSGKSSPNVALAKAKIGKF